MRKKYTFIVLLFIIIIGCENNDDGPYGKIVFYTNAQAMLNCGPFDVNVYIENKKVGILSSPVIDEFEPNCSQSQFTLQVKQPPGHYTCKATACNSLKWQIEIEVSEDSCLYVFLDIHNFHQ